MAAGVAAVLTEVVDSRAAVGTMAEDFPVAGTMAAPRSAAPAEDTATGAGMGLKEVAVPMATCTNRQARPRTHGLPKDKESVTLRPDGMVFRDHPAEKALREGEKVRPGLAVWEQARGAKAPPEYPVALRLMLRRPMVGGTLLRVITPELRGNARLERVQEPAPPWLRTRMCPHFPADVWPRSALRSIARISSVACGVGVGAAVGAGEDGVGAVGAGALAGVGDGGAGDGVGGPVGAGGLLLSGIGPHTGTTRGSTIIPRNTFIRIHKNRFHRVVHFFAQCGLGDRSRSRGRLGFPRDFPLFVETTENSLIYFGIARITMLSINLVFPT